MTNLRARIKVALLEHYPLGKSREEWVCGACYADFHNFRYFEDHIADVLLSLPGIAIVEEPKPDGAVWRIDDDFEVSTIELAYASEAFSSSPTRHPGCKIEWGSLELNLVSQEARALAAALLAAADAAEAADD